MRESFDNNFSRKSVSPKKNDNSSSVLTMQSLSNLIQSGSIQIVHDKNGRYQDFCKYDMQVGFY